MQHIFTVAAIYDVSIYFFLSLSFSKLFACFLSVSWTRSSSSYRNIPGASIISHAAQSSISFPDLPPAMLKKRTNIYWTVYVAQNGTQRTSLLRLYSTRLSKWIHYCTVVECPLLGKGEKRGLFFIYYFSLPFLCPGSLFSSLFSFLWPQRLGFFLSFFL